MRELVVQVLESASIAVVVAIIAIAALRFGLPPLSDFLIAYYNRRGNRMLSAENARREYEYTARQKLYSEIEPLVFQLFEDSKHTVNRLSRLTTVNYESSYYDNENHLYVNREDIIKFSVHRIFLPLIYHDIFKRKMTFIELTENKFFYVIYHLLMIYYWTFGDNAFKDAKDIPSELSSSQTGTSSQETIRSDTLNMAIHEMIVAGKEHPDRPISFGEFLALYDKSGTESCSAIRRIVKFYTDEPKKRPALNNMMLAQFCLSYVIHNACAMRKYDLQHLRSILDSKDAPWANVENFGREDVNRAIAYVRERLRDELFDKYFYIDNSFSA